MRSLSHFISELKRRNVFRAGAAYLVLAWLVVQVADILLDAFAAPNWVMRTLIVALGLGFPASLILSWIYEITVEGVKLTDSAIWHMSGPEAAQSVFDQAILVAEENLQIDPTDYSTSSSMMVSYASVGDAE